MVGELRTSAQITNYTEDELRERLVVSGAINLGTKRIAGLTSEFLVLGASTPTARCGLQLEDTVKPGTYRVTRSALRRWEDFTGSSE